MLRLLIVLALVLFATPALADDEALLQDFINSDSGLQTSDQYFGTSGGSGDREQYRVYDHGHGNVTVEDERGNRDVYRIYDHGNGNVTVERR